MSEIPETKETFDWLASITGLALGPDPATGNISASGNWYGYLQVGALRLQRFTRSLFLLLTGYLEMLAGTWTRTGTINERNQ